MENYFPELLKSGIIIVVVLIIRWTLIIAIKRFARKIERLEHRTGMVVRFIDYAVIFLIVLGMFLIWGVEFNDVGFVLSSVFAVIGVALFAQWSILSNVTSGIIMFFTFPYKIGDFIIIHDKEYDFEGVIEDIKGFHVVIKTKNDEIITYPNSLMLQKGVTVIKPDEIDEFLGDDDKNVKEQPID
jgi:small-conductance mechanosensitive channel